MRFTKYKFVIFFKISSYNFIKISTIEKLPSRCALQFIINDFV